tara:strand:- start:1664 stop:2203 length:540 start_codon:yes stop_codon:yes gene_type:complete
MGNRLSKITTKTGDNGSTGLADNTRIKKNSFRIQAIGDIDELNSNLGLLLSMEISDLLKKELIIMQHDLFDLGGELSIPNSSIINENQIKEIENLISKHNDKLEPLKEFILPSGTSAASQAHVSRTVCRRAERSLVSLSIKDKINPNSLKYVNRLSDYLFILARVFNKQSGKKDVFWKK